jgi:hypothetical protein
MIKSRKMRWAGHVVRMERREIRTRYWLGNLKKGNHYEDQGIDGKIADIKMDLKKLGWEGVPWFIWLRIGSIGGLL